MPRGNPTGSRTPFVPMENLRVLARDGSSILLQSKSLTARVSAVAEDIFRLRVARGREFSTLSSWAVARTEWPDVPMHIAHTARRVSLQTACGRLSLNLADGRLDLKD